MHHVRRWTVSTLALRTDRYGRRIAPPGTLYAECTCGWSMTLEHVGTDYEQASGTLDVATEGHLNGAAVQETPNAGHPLFRMPPKKYIKKAGEFEAVQWKGNNGEEFRRAGYWAMEHEEGFALAGKAGYPVVKLDVNDWLVKTPDGQLLGLTDEQFNRAFEEVPQSPRLFKYPVC